MISQIGSYNNTDAGLPGGTGRTAGGTVPSPRPRGGRAEAEHGEVAAAFAALPASLQAALHRVLRAAPGAAGSVAALADAAQKPDVMDGVDGALNLNGGGAATLLGRLEGMSREEAEGVLKVLADLLRHGVVGYEYRWINGEPHKVFIGAAIGSDLHRAPPVRGGRFDGLF